MLEVFGPSGEAQTLGLAVPNRAFYQLNYTRIFSFCYYTTLGAKIKDFPVCGQSCGQSRFSARFRDPAKSRKRPRCKAFRAFTSQVVNEVSNGRQSRRATNCATPGYLLGLLFCGKVRRAGVDTPYTISSFPGLCKTAVKREGTEPLPYCFYHKSLTDPERPSERRCGR